VRLYEVQLGDSQASIAAKPEMAGCPKCGGADFVRANPHKPTHTHPNGYVSFLALHVGEKLALPEKWFNGDLDARPRSYFAALPHPDGVTPSKLGVGAAGVLGDYAALDVASAKVGAIAALSDQPFSAAVNDTAAAIDASVQEVAGVGAPAVYAIPYAQEVRRATNQARQRNVALLAAIAAGDQSAGFQARSDITHELSGALVSARLALQAFYGDAGQTPIPTPVVAVAQAAAAAIGADPNFCTSIAQPGSAVNAAVHSFKTAWNAANPGSPVPINTGTYEQATADAIAHVLGTAPVACAARATVPAFQSPPGTTTLTPPQEPQGLSTGAIVSLGLLGAGVVGGALYLATREPPARVRRVYPRPRKRPGPSPIRRERYDTIGPWKRA
jgi:hypothetical protein